MSSNETSRGAWNCRALVAIVAVVASLAMTGNLFGGPPRYVTADSSVFAAGLLDVSADSWAREMDAAAAFVEPEPSPSFVAASIPSDTTPIEPTKGGGTVCPAVYTVCPQTATKCQETVCPPNATNCPQEYTKCPVRQTLCPTDPTKCHFTVCPQIATHCPTDPTKCETTKCPPTTTLCPVDPTKCEYTVCPKTTACGGEKTICYVGTPSSDACKVEPGGGSASLTSPARRQLVARGERATSVAHLATTFVPRAN
jgi:hypothetical protein